MGAHEATSSNQATRWTEKIDMLNSTRLHEQVLYLYPAETILEMIVLGENYFACRNDRVIHT
jgi:hypothetical protein